MFEDINKFVFNQMVFRYLLLLMIMSTGISWVQCDLEFNLNYTILENQQPGLQIGVISIDLMHYINENPEKNKRNLQFDSTFSYVLRDKNSYFLLDDKTSSLKTIKKIDLEELCPKLCDKTGKGYLKLVVNVWKQNQLRAVINVLVVIGDKNDHVPTFPMKVFRKKIKEVLYGVGRFIDLPKAIDKDVSAINKQISYRLNRDSDTFKLVVSPDNPPQLKLLKKIDYEEKRRYELTLMAWNDIQPESKSYLRIEIIVIDINDCEPKFVTPEFPIVIDENMKVGKIIGKLKAIDKDETSVLVYEIDESSSNITRRTFRIEKNGDIVLIKSLDVNQEREFHFSVKAMDGEFVGKAKVNILVQDVNNHPPSYSLNPSTLKVLENQPNNTLIGQVTISDVDSSEVNGIVKCSEPIGKSNRQSLIFDPDPAKEPHYKKYSLFTIGQLDREKTPVEFVYLICHDGGLHKRLTSTLTISVIVTDINDNPPIFTVDVYNAHIKENNRIGDNVINVQATDNDIDENSIIVYSIKKSPSSPIFSIDEKFGFISAMRILNREDQDKYEIIVLASDPTGKFSTSATVKVSVTDVNDNTPRILPPTQFSIQENLPSRQLIGNLTARDADAGKNGQVYFKLKSRDSSAYFEIHDNGSIFSKVSFDREKMKKHCLSVIVSDFGSPSNKLETRVCIEIKDVNDNSPVIHVASLYDLSEYPRTSNGQNSSDTIIASVHESPGQKIATLTSHDKDEGENAKCIFILSDADLGSNSAIQLFTIDDAEGAIKISRIMSRDNLGRYKVKISAQDMGTPSLRGEKIITIEIRDIEPLATAYDNVSSSGFFSNGNVMIVIILSVISAFLTALLIGAILCMIKPCCHSHHPPNNNAGTRNSQTLLHKVPLPSSNEYFQLDNGTGNNNQSNIQNQINNFDELQTWRDSIVAREYLNQQNNITIDCYGNSTLQKGEFIPYEISTDNICGISHVLGKTNGCNCGQGPCLRYGAGLATCPSANYHPQQHSGGLTKPLNTAHNTSSTYCLLNHAPEEQCSDSGRGASDDDTTRIFNSTLTTSGIGVGGGGILQSVAGTLPRHHNINIVENHQYKTHQTPLWRHTSFTSSIPVSIETQQLPLATVDTSSFMTNNNNVEISNNNNYATNMSNSSTLPNDMVALTTFQNPINQSRENLS